MAQNTRSVVLDLYGGYFRYIDEGRVRLGALIELLEVFGIEATTTRVTLSRLKKDGWFATTRVGRESTYQLSERMLHILDDGRSRIFTRADDEWDGCWTQVVYQVPESSRGTREAVRKQLLWHGFGQFASSIWISPHDNAEELAQLRLDFPEATVDVLRVRSTSLTGDAEISRRCWDLDELDGQYREFIDRFSYLTADGAIAALSGSEALVVRTQLIAEVRRLTFSDPDLPIELLPEHWSGRRAFEFFRRVYSALGPGAEAFVESVVGLSVKEWSSPRIP